MELLWLDLETSGLDPHKDVILEIAACRAYFDTPFQIRQTCEMVIGDQAFNRYECHPVVQEMHTKNGLWAAVEKSEVKLRDAEDWIIEYMINKITQENREEQTTLAGSCVFFDLGFINVHMPKLAKYLHYRVYDVSAVSIYLRSLGMPRPPKVEAHRAMADVVESMELGHRCSEWIAQRSL